MGSQARLSEVRDDYISGGGIKSKVTKDTTLTNSKGQNLVKSKKIVKTYDKPGDLGFFTFEYQKGFTK